MNSINYELRKCTAINSNLLVSQNLTWLSWILFRTLTPSNFSSHGSSFQTLWIRMNREVFPFPPVFSLSFVCVIMVTNTIDAGHSGRAV
jgi:hypothetical protein